MNQLNQKNHIDFSRGHSPRVISLPKIGDDETGFLSFAENKSLIPFDVKRVYWVYATPNFIERGNHGHLETEQLCIAIQGKIEFQLEDLNGLQSNFVLSAPDHGLFIPKGYWRRILYRGNAVLLVLASTNYLAEDYIRDYKDWTALKKRKFTVL